MQKVDGVFARLAAMYGSKFADQWASVDASIVKATWGAALDELGNDEIAAGLQALVRRGSPFPPTLPEFYALCRPRVEVPPESDHAGLDAMARRLSVSTAGCQNYFALRQRLLERVAVRSRLPAIQSEAA